MAKKFAMDWGKITQKVKEAESKSGYEKDSRIYVPKVKDNGTAKALIRFLPQKDTTKVPYVKVYSHGFKVGASWFVNNCPTTLGSGNECPVCKENMEMWDSDPDTVRERSRKLSVYSNILVIKDYQNPDNDGKVFLFRYGKTIFDKIMKQFAPSDDDLENGAEPINVFDFYNGLNFKLEIKTKKTQNKSFLNYDDANFSETVTEVADGDETEIERINSECYDLDDFISPDKFKSYNELEERFFKIIGKTKKTKIVEKNDDESESYDEDVEESDDTEVKTKTEEKKTSSDAFFEKIRKNISK